MLRLGLVRLRLMAMRFQKEESNPYRPLRRFRIARKIHRTMRRPLKDCTKCHQQIRCTRLNSHHEPRPPPLFSHPRCSPVCDQKKRPYVLSSRADRSRSCKVASSTLRLASHPRPFCCEADPLRPPIGGPTASTRPRGRLVRHRDYCAAPSSLRRRSDDVFWGGLDAQGYPPLHRCGLCTLLPESQEGPLGGQGSFPSDSECPLQNHKVSGTLLR